MPGSRPRKIVLQLEDGRDINVKWYVTGARRTPHRWRTVSCDFCPENYVAGGAHAALRPRDG